MFALFFQKIRNLTIFEGGLIWHISQSSKQTSIYFNLILKLHSNPFLEPTTTKGCR